MFDSCMLIFKRSYNSNDLLESWTMEGGGERATMWWLFHDCLERKEEHPQLKNGLMFDILFKIFNSKMRDLVMKKAWVPSTGGTGHGFNFTSIYICI